MGVDEMTSEEALLRAPDLAQWAMWKFPDQKDCRDLSRLVETFDRKLFVVRCDRCKRKATVAYGKIGDHMLTFRCTKHDPGEASGLVLASVHKVLTVIAGDNRPLKRHLVRKLARAKGLPQKAGKREASAFFRSWKELTSEEALDWLDWRDDIKGRKYAPEYAPTGYGPP